MEMNGVLDTSFAVITSLSLNVLNFLSLDFLFFPLNFMVLFCLSLTCELNCFQVNRVDTCCKVVGVFLSVLRGWLLEMHLYF